MKLLTEQIGDKYTRESLQRVENFVNSNPLMAGDFKHLDLVLAAAVYPATVVYPHGLTYVPNDLIQTYHEGADLVWNFAQFTKTHLFATIQGSCHVRLFIGRYDEGRNV
jgi:hypothetical protein